MRAGRSIGVRECESGLFTKSRIPKSRLEINWKIAIECVLSRHALCPVARVANTLELITVSTSVACILMPQLQRDITEAQRPHWRSSLQGEHMWKRMNARTRTRTRTHTHTV
eukprot:2041570-Pyramimonas_sp.AAC.2